MKTYKSFYTEKYFKQNYYKGGVKKSFFTPARKYKERDRDILRLLVPDKKDVVLELGCADGTTSKKISKYVKKVIAVDFVKVAIKLAKEKNAGENIEYKVADATGLFFLRDSSIDKIAAIDFIEHVNDVTFKKVLSEAYRVLKPRGVVAVYTPQRLHWTEIIKHILKKEPVHIGVRTPNEIIKIGKNEGFKVSLLYFSPNPYAGLRWVDKILLQVPIINKFFRFRTCLRLKK